MTTPSRNDLISEFARAPDSALFDENYVAAWFGCSCAKLQRDRWSGNGLPFLKIGRSVRYRKSDVLEAPEPLRSTSERKGEDA